jgi:hypothetical protein
LTSSQLSSLIFYVLLTLSVWNCTTWTYNSVDSNVYSVCNTPDELFLAILEMKKGTASRIGSGSITTIPYRLVFPRTFAIDSSKSLAYFSWTAQRYWFLPSSFSSLVTLSPKTYCSSSDKSVESMYYSMVDLTTGVSTTQYVVVSLFLHFHTLSL